MTAANHNRLYKIALEGYHGTDRANCESIITNNFDPSPGDDHWVGNGAYFFVTGISSDPCADAVNWAVAHAWDKSAQANRYSQYGILQVLIEVHDEFLLDLSTLEGIQTFNYLRKLFVDKIKQAKKKLPRGQIQDGHIINKAREELDIRIDVVKGDFYFKFTPERVYNINSRVPNVTIVAVHNVHECLELRNISLNCEGDIVQ